MRLHSVLRQRAYFPPRRSRVQLRILRADFYMNSQCFLSQSDLFASSRKVSVGHAANRIKQRLSDARFPFPSGRYFYINYNTTACRPCQYCPYFMRRRRDSASARFSRIPHGIQKSRSAEWQSGNDVRYFQASARTVEKNQTSGISISISLPIFAERQIPSMIAWLMMICEVGTGDSV